MIKENRLKPRHLKYPLPNAVPQYNPSFCTDLVPRLSLNNFTQTKKVNISTTY